MMRYSLKQQLVLCFQVIELGQHMHEGTSEQHVYALVGPGEEPAVHLLPDSPQTEALLNASTSPCTSGAAMPPQVCCVSVHQ